MSNIACKNARRVWGRLYKSETYTNLSELLTTSKLNFSFLSKHNNNNNRGGGGGGGGGGDGVIWETSIIRKFLVE
jgi:hypothetical protein